MPLAATLRLDPTTSAPVEALWSVLADAGLDASRRDLRYPPHVTLAIWPDDAPAKTIAATLDSLAAGRSPLPVTLAGIGVFPGAPAVLWLVPVPDPALLAFHATLVAALPDLPCHPHYRPGGWVPHVTLGEVADAGPAVALLAPRWSGLLSGKLERLDLVRFPPVTLLRSLPLDPHPSI